MAEMIEVPKTEDGTRLLRWFLRRYPAMPQREFYKLCRGGQIRVNSSRAQGQEILRAGDVVRVPPTLGSYSDVPGKKTENGAHFSLADLESLRQSIIHNDDDIVVFNKPAGLAVQGGTGIRKSVDKWRRHYSRMIKFHWFIDWIGKQAVFWSLQKISVLPRNYPMNFKIKLRTRNIWRY